MEERDLLQCVETALDGCGADVKNEIFWKMAILHNASKSQVISDPYTFVRTIEETFGNSATMIEISIINEIGKKFNLSANVTRSLAEAINEAKKQLTITSSTERN